MTKFIHKCLIFLTIVLSVAFIVDTAIVYLIRYHKSGLVYGAWNDIYPGGLDCDIVIMGNSRAYMQYNPAILDSLLQTSSWNLGTYASFINRQVIKYNFYRRYNKKPKIIIQDIGHSTLGITKGIGKYEYYPFFFDLELKEEFLQYEELNFLERELPAYRYHGKVLPLLLSFILKSRAPVRGFWTRDVVWTGEIPADVTEVHTLNDTTAIRIFDTYLAKAKDEDIQVIFVYSPLYIEGIEKLVDIEEMRSVFAGFAEKYDIPILDFTYDPISYDTQYFINVTHLNTRGADLFTTKLATAIDSLGVLRF